MNEHSSKTQNNPVTSEQAPLELAIVGAGFAGLYALYRAQASGRSALAFERGGDVGGTWYWNCLLYTSPSPRDGLLSRMPSSA